MNALPKNVNSLIEEFSRLPGIGPKSAQRLTMHLLYLPDARGNSLAKAINELKKDLQFCGVCWNISEKELCVICSDVYRNKLQICVVEEILDVVAIERTAEYHGAYHVLHGVLSPVDGIGPEQLKIDELVKRVNNIIEMDKTLAKHDIEIIVATNPNLEGETTALYLVRCLKPLGVLVTRIARGLPAGGDLDYADDVTLSKALEGRREIIQ